MSLSDDQRALVRCVYDWLFEHGRPPTSAEIAAHLRRGGTAADVRRELSELKVGKTILPHPVTGEIWMAGPFASTPTDYSVSSARVTWWANCAWDMLGVAALADQPVRIDARCIDCGDRFTVSVDDPGHVDLPPWVVHFLVPARQWYDDIGFT
jgi:hypothetical protein